MNKEYQKSKSWLVGILMAFILIGLDQLTKYLAVMHLAGTDGIVLIPGVFELQYLENRGAAFGMFQNRQWMFLIMTSFILLVIAYSYQKLPLTKRHRPLRILAMVLAAGAVGNMIDRIFRGFVVDFFYFSLVDFPVFNVADCYVVVSMIALLIFIFFYYKDEDLEFLFHKKAKEDEYGNH